MNPMTSNTPARTALASLRNDRTPAGAEDFRLAALGLLAELESSFLASQKALLALDAAGLESCTGEQIRLSELLRAVLAQKPSADSPQFLDLPVAARGVLHLTLVQASLLRRARRSVNLVSHLLKGPGALYGPLHSESWPLPECPIEP